MIPLLTGLLADADPTECAAHSFDHYHVHGLRYINLLRSPALTAKLYIMRPGETRPDFGVNLVHPHNHAYAFDTWVLCGQMTNVIFKQSDNGREFYHKRYTYNANAPRFDNAGVCRLDVDRTRTLTAGESYHLSTDQIHTIAAPSDALTVLFLLQYRDVLHSTDLFMTAPGPPRMAGLYQPVDDSVVARELAFVRVVLGELNRPSPHRPTPRPQENQNLRDVINRCRRCDDGYLFANTDYGNYSHEWTHAGNCFRRFMLSINPDQLLNKAAIKEYDGTETERAVRRAILELRRKRELTSEQARDEWDLVDEFIDEHRDGFALWYTSTNLEETNEFYQRSYPAQARQFAAVVWPVLCEALRAELAAEADVPTATETTAP
jgi:hypothetical protein